MAYYGRTADKFNKLARPKPTPNRVTSMVQTRDGNSVLVSVTLPKGVRLGSGATVVGHSPA